MTENRGRARAVVVTAVGVLLAVVIVAPIALSSSDLVRWGASPDGLGLSAPWPWLVFVALDAAAAACVGMVVLSAWRGEGGGAFHVLVWVFAFGSAAANYSHGRATPAPDDEVFFPAMSITGPLLLDVTLSRVRRWAKEDDGRKLKGIGPRDFGVWRWVPGVAFGETFAAWRAAHREGFTTPGEALTFVREVAALAELPPADALRFAFDALGSRDVAPARAWLTRRGVKVGQDAIDAVTSPAAAVTVIDLRDTEPAPVPPLVEPALPAVELPSGPPSSPVADPSPASGVPVAELPSELPSVQPVTSPAGVVVPAVPPAPPTPGAGLPVNPDPDADVRAMTKRAAVRHAFAVLGSREVPAAREWLAARGVQVDSSDAYSVRRSLPPAEPSEPTEPSELPRRLSAVRVGGGQ